MHAIMLDTVNKLSWPKHQGLTMPVWYERHAYAAPNTTLAVPSLGGTLVEWTCQHAFAQAKQASRHHTHQLLPLKSAGEYAGDNKQ